MRSRLFAVVLTCLISSPALANVIYDVTFSYAPPAATLTFTMEFADSTGVKDELDLIGGDVTAEALIIDGTPWTFVGPDDPPLGLAFNPATLSLTFSFTDFYQHPSLSQSCFQEFPGSLACEEGGHVFFVGVQSIEVVQRRVTDVPEPGVLLLLALAVPGMLLMRRSAIRRKK